MKGIVKAFSMKTKGIKLDDEQWYNPEDIIKDTMTEGIKGKMVKLDISNPEQRKFKSFTILLDESKPPQVSQSSKDVRFSRGASLNTAIKIVEISGKMKNEDPSKVLDECKTLALDIEAWVKND